MQGQPTPTPGINTAPAIAPLAEGCLTPQQIFDKVALHLLRQGLVSVNSAGNCLYRSPEGLKCAIGCLIPDERYSPDFEGGDANTVDYLIAHNSRFAGALKATGIDTQHHVSRDLLASLQKLHDHTAPRAWGDVLVGLARAYRLDDSVVTSFQPGSPA